MAKPLSEDLRSRLVAAVDSGMSRRAAAERFGVSAASAVRWMQAWRANGLTRAKPQGGDKRSHRIEAYRDIILAAIEAQADITLVELADMLAVTFKKNRPRQRAGTIRHCRTAQGLVRRAA